VLLSDADGRDLVVAVARLTFARARPAAGLSSTHPWCGRTKHQDKPGKLSLAAAADFAPGKPRADVIVSARAPRAAGAHRDELSVRVGRSRRGSR
jgi:hypothetical protein